MSARVARETLEANAFQTHTVIGSIKLDFEVARPEMRESTALGSALLARAAIGLFGWDLARPKTAETLARINT
ncbi:hypothetical protein F5888DRAFT_1951000, partial [Russula emetica]